MQAEPLDTPVPDAFQARLETALRGLLADLDADGEHRRELPPPGGEPLALEAVPELAGVTFAVPPDEPLVTAELRFTDEPASRVPVVPADVAEPAYDFPARVTERSATYLGELGGAYGDLSAAVVETLATYCEAPSYAPQAAFRDGEADLLCVSCYGEVLTFACHVRRAAGVAGRER